MYDDGFEATHPVYVNVLLPSQINGIFDSITYDKGAALLFMLESIVGETNFREGLKVNN
jgi:aminopeptidase N